MEIMPYLGGVAALIAAVFAIYQFAVNRKDKIILKLNGMETTIKNLDAKIDERTMNIKTQLEAHIEATEEEKAVTARVRIQRTADDILSGKVFNKEYLDSILESITFYNNYCAFHPDFTNNKTVVSQAIITKQYEAGNFKNEE